MRRREWLARLVVIPIVTTLTLRSYHGVCAQHPWSRARQCDFI